MGNSNEIMKMIFTLKSGKSIVIHMYKDHCLNIYEQVLKYDINNNTMSDKINLCKKCKDDITEAIVLFISELAALQINEPDEKISKNIYKIVN